MFPYFYFIAEFYSLTSRFYLLTHLDIEHYIIYNTSLLSMKKVRKSDALDYHSKGRPGKIEIVPTKETKTQRDLALAYSPGVAEPCMEIYRNPENVYKYTTKGNLVAVVTNGTAVLGYMLISMYLILSWMPTMSKILYERSKPWSQHLVVSTWKISKRLSVLK